MVMDYFLTGGIIEISKNDFAKEMMRKDSILRYFLGHSLNNNNESSIQRDDKGKVRIDFHKLDEIKLCDDPELLIGRLKERYGDKISGKLYFKSIYSTFNQTYYFNIDLG